MTQTSQATTAYRRGDAKQTGGFRTSFLMVEKVWINK